MEKPAYITFWDEERRPLKLSVHEYQEIMKVWEVRDNFVIQGHVIHKKTIKFIDPPEKSKPLALPAPDEKPISKEKMAKVREQIEKLKQKYSI